MTKQYTEADIDKMLLPQLRSTASQYFEAADLKGLKKADLVTLLKENIATINGSEGEEPEVDEDDDELDDEVDDTVEEEDDSDEEDDDEIDDSVLDEAEEEDEVDDTPAPAPKRTRAVKAKPAPADTPPEPTGDTLTAKQVATRIGTDSKTLRKFFRSDKSTVEAVGQGGRYEFAKDDLEKIQREFDAWNGTRSTRAPKAAAEPKAPAEPKRKVVDDELDDDDTEIDDEEIEEPTDEEIDDLELDDLELDD